MKDQDIIQEDGKVERICNAMEDLYDTKTILEIVTDCIEFGSSRSEGLPTIYNIDSIGEIVARIPDDIKNIAAAIYEQILRLNRILIEPEPEPDLRSSTKTHENNEQYIQDRKKRLEEKLL